MNSAIQFDAEVNKYLGNNDKKWKVVSALKNAAVLLIMVVLTYFSMKTRTEKVNNIILVLIMLVLSESYGIIEGYRGRGIENDTTVEIIGAVIGLFFPIVMMCIGIILS